MTLLSKYTVKDLHLPSKLVSLSHPGHTLFDSIQVLAEHQLLSAPVLDKDGKLLGVLDALDVAAYVVDTVADGKSDLEDVAIDTIMGRGHPGGCKYAEVELEEPLDKVAEVISGQARRAIVIGPDGAPLSVVTQSVLLQFIHHKRGELDCLKACGPAKDYCSSGAVCVNESEPALNAFQTIRRLGVWSVAILGEDGCMISVISATDLVVGLNYMPDKRQALKALQAASVVDFVAVNRQMEISDKASTVSARPDQSLESVLEKLSACRVHRVVVCVDRKPVGVLSLSDICRAVAAFGKGT